jgi:dihydroflavonol-4-reductase
MKVLVTGATGFLGGWLTRRLVEEGHDVRIIKRASSSLEELEGLKLETAPGDVTDLNSLLAACKGMDTVFHLAGLIAYSRARRQAMENVNVHGTANVIEACRQAGVRKLVYMSSVVTVGASFDGKIPLDESAEYNVGHLDLGYSETKRAAEKLVLSAVKNSGLDAVLLNPATIYGPGDAKKGSRGTQLKVAQGKFPMYPPGGVNIISVEDVVSATLRAWKDGRTGERYILSGDNLLIKEAFDLIAKIAGAKPSWLAMPRTLIFGLGLLGDSLELIGKKGPINTENAWMSVLYHWFDSSKAQKELGLKPRPASYAIEQSVKWIKDAGLLD